MPSTVGIVASGNYGFSPLDLSPRAWFDAADTSTIVGSGGAVSQWNDKSGNGKNVSQATASAQPRSGSATLNGRNLLSFNGSNVLIASTASDWDFLVDGTVNLVGIVLRSSTTGANTAALSTQSTSTTSGWRWAHLSTNSYEHFVRNASAAVVSNAQSSAGTSAYAVTILTDLNNATAADRSAFAINAGSLTKNNTTSATAPTSAAALAVGARTSTLFWNGTIGEIVIVSGANATETNRATLHSYLRTKWGL